MPIAPKKKELTDFLREKNAEFSLLSSAIMDFDDENFQSALKFLAESYSSLNRNILSPYLMKTLEKRANPKMAYPWAKSLLFIAVPLKNLPDVKLKMPHPDKKNKNGLMAAYAGKSDYHIYCRTLIAKFADSLKNFLGKDFKSEICVDTKPVAEKILAKFAGLGEIGFNSCLLCNGSSSFFIASAFLDEAIISCAGADRVETPCANCGKCRKLCPGNALNNGVLNTSKCVSYLTMEKKGEFNQNEKESIGNWIFGCDKCVKACPMSAMPPPLEINLDWFLSLTENDFKETFRESACLYAGWEKLRRNAETVLQK
jgi:epoxyqueuosine reductase